MKSDGADANACINMIGHTSQSLVVKQLINELEVHDFSS